MKKLIAVRVEQKDGRTILTGYVHRGKNRRRVWTIDADTDNPQDLRQMVEDKEDARLKFTGG